MKKNDEKKILTKFTVCWHIKQAVSRSDKPDNYARSLNVFFFSLSLLLKG